MSSANALILEKSGFRATTGHSPAREIVELIMSKRCWQSNPSTDATTTWPSSVTYSMTPSTRVT